MEEPIKKEVPPAVKAFFAEIGRKNGNALLAKHGKEYFKRISAMRKIHGRQKASTPVVPVTPPVEPAV